MNHRARRLPRLAALTLIGGLLGALLGRASRAASRMPTRRRRNQIPDEPAEALYNQGMAALQVGQYRRCGPVLRGGRAQHPYSAIAPQARDHGCLCLLPRQRYDEAIGAIDHFLDLHPGNKDAAYAYYLKALCYYEQIEDVRRDQKMTEQALAALQEVVDRFPNTALCPRCRPEDRSDPRPSRRQGDGDRALVRGPSCNISRPSTASARVVEKYQTTSHVPEALERLTECYLALGVTDEAQTAAAVLGYNYPGSSWYQVELRSVERRRT